MSVQTMLSNYRDLLVAKVELQKKDLDLAIEIQVCEKQMELEVMLAVAGSASSSGSEDFIERHRSELEPDDFEFLEDDYRGTKAVVDHTGIPATSLKRLASEGKIETKKTANGHFRFSTISVVGYLINAKAAEET